MTTVMSSF